MASNVSISLSGLGIGTGLNDTSIISQLVAIDSIPLTSLESQATGIANASSAISSFSAAMSKLQAAANTLADPTQYNVYTATSSASQLVATTTTGAAGGTHSVSVSQLAAAQTTLSNAQGSSTGALGLSGTLGMTINGTTVNVSVGSGDSLADIASNISSSGAAVTASVVFDGTQYRLEVQGTQTGAANAINFDESGFSLGLSTAANTFQAAQDTKATVDGISVTSPTNQINKAIPGVNLAATGLTSGAASVTVAADSSSLATQITSFVTAYNSVVTTGHTDAGYGTALASNTLLASDPGIDDSLSQLSSLVAGTVGGTDASYNTLGSIGLSLNADGTLALDSSTLSQAVQSDPTGVEKLFVTSASQGMTGIMGTISSTIDALANNAGSVLQGETTFYSARTKEVSSDETALQARITAYQAQLQTEFSNADELVNNERTLFTAVGGTGTFM